MKRLVNLLCVCAILSSAPTMVFADTTINDSEKITDPKAIYDLLAPFVGENFAKEVVVTYNSYDKEEDIQEHVSIMINNPPIGASASYETEIVNAIENFMNENNITSVPIFVNDDARVDVSVNEKITDPKVIYDLLAPFVEENFAKEVVVTYNSYDKEEDIQEHVSIRINNPPIGASASYETEIVNAIENFMNENNIISVPILVNDDARALDWDESDFSNAANMTTGDINSDGKVDVTDLSELSLALVGDKVLTEAQQKAADVDGDGTVKLADLAKYRQYLSKVISSLG